MLPLLPVAVGSAGLIAIGKRKEARRRAAAANEFSKKYPLSDNPNEMATLINQADLELKTFKGLPANNKAQRRVKTRNVDTLQSWLNVMKEHNKDVMALSSAQSVIVKSEAASPNWTRRMADSLADAYGNMQPKTNAELIKSVTDISEQNTITQQTANTGLPSSSMGMSSGMVSTPDASGVMGGTEGAESEDEKPAIKKKNNVIWLVIGGIAVAAILFNRMSKK
jgi:UDP-N-acetylenolpyruvoylglucosamine reductase